MIKIKALDHFDVDITSTYIPSTHLLPTMTSALILIADGTEEMELYFISLRTVVGLAERIQ